MSEKRLAEQRLFVSDAEISKLVQRFTAQDHIHPLRMILWRLPRVLRYYREQRFWKKKPWLGIGWLWAVLK